MAEPTIFRVTPKGNQWQVVPARAGVAALYPLKERAVKEARAQAREAQPSTVVVHTRDGGVEAEFTIENEPLPPRRSDLVGWSPPPGRLAS
jgi:hypothetical protein